MPVELCAMSNFTFLTGASHPEEYMRRALEVGLSAIAIAIHAVFDDVGG